MSDEKKRRQYGSGSVFQRKDGMWIGRFEAGFDRDGRRRQITVSATTEPRCKEKLEKKKREIARNGVPEKGASNLTVNAWADAWLKQIVTELRPSSYRTTASAVKVWIKPVIGRRRISQIGPADFRAIYQAQREESKGTGTMVRTHAVLTKMLKDAVRDGHIVQQSALLAKKPSLGETDRLAIPASDAVKILQSVAGNPAGSAWAAALLQGLRQGERLGLTWDCVDFENDLIDVSWQLQPLPYIDNRNKQLGFRTPDEYKSVHLEHAYHLVRPKSAAGRRNIPMVLPMHNALLAWRKIAPKSPHNLVWPDTKGRPQSAAEDREAWKDLQEKAGVAHPSGRPYVLHEARHATATLLKSLDVPDDIIEAILGHVKFVKVYDHSDKMPAMRKALNKVAKQLTAS